MTKNILLNSIPFEPAKCPWEMTPLPLKIQNMIMQGLTNPVC
jgi:hypothetical protein